MCLTIKIENVGGLWNWKVTNVETREIVAQGDAPTQDEAERLSNNERAARVFGLII